jgi:hypothetical protein
MHQPEEFLQSLPLGCERRLGLPAKEGDAILYRGLALEL